MNFIANSEQSFEVLGNNIHTYFFSYDPKKPIGIILPGHRSDTKRLIPFIKLLEEKYNIISFDLPGFGKSTLNSSFEEYISFCREILKEMLQKLGIKYEETTLFGISLSSNIIIDFLINYPDINFKKIGLMGPIYSCKNITMKKPYKKFVDWFTSNLEKGKKMSKITQKLFDNKRLFTACMIMFDIECWKSKAIRDYEYEQWHLQTLQHWGATLKDFLEIDLSKLEQKINHENVIFAYPRSDQYLHVEDSIKGFKNLFPNAEFKFFESSKHVPRGNFSEDKEFMDSVRNIISLVA